MTKDWRFVGTILSSKPTLQLQVGDRVVACWKNTSENNKNKNDVNYFWRKKNNSKPANHLKATVVANPTPNDPLDRPFWPEMKPIINGIRKMMKSLIECTRKRTLWGRLRLWKKNPRLRLWKKNKKKHKHKHKPWKRTTTTTTTTWNRKPRLTTTTTTTTFHKKTKKTMLPWKNRLPGNSIPRKSVASNENNLIPTRKTTRISLTILLLQLPNLPSALYLPIRPWPLLGMPYWTTTTTTSKEKRPWKPYKKKPRGC